MVSRSHNRHVRLEVAQFNEDGAHLGEVALDHVGGHVQQRPLLRIDVEDELRHRAAGQQLAQPNGRCGPVRLPRPVVVRIGLCRK